MRTTLTLDEDVAARLAEMQKRTGMSFKEIVNQTLRQGLERQQASLKKITGFKVKARPLGQVPGLQYSNIGELLEQLEGVRHR
ncbi:MAG: CopG family transcriptional regulator [Acidobacteriota bacterium]|nr:MAG: CopG family transcriptional regulator [Acidobacteriota bacterium]